MNSDSYELTVTFTAEDIRPPEITETSPHDTALAPGFIILSAVTDEPAVVRYGTDPDAAFAAMPYTLNQEWDKEDLAGPLGSPTSYSHTATIVERETGKRTYYLRAQDEAGNISEPAVITYRISEPDLVVEEFSISPDTVNAGHEAVVTLTVCNDGEGWTHTILPAWVVGKISGEGPGWLYDPFWRTWLSSEIEGGNIGPGESKTLTFYINAPEFGGQYSMEVKLNPSSVIAESDNTNNTVSWSGNATAHKFRVKYCSAPMTCYASWSNWAPLPGVTFPTESTSAQFTGQNGRRYPFRVQACAERVNEDGTTEEVWHPLPVYPIHRDLMAETAVDTSELRVETTNVGMTEFSFTWTQPEEANGTVLSEEVKYWPSGECLQNVGYGWLAYLLDHGYSSSWYDSYEYFPYALTTLLSLDNEQGVLANTTTEFTISNLWPETYHYVMVKRTREVPTGQYGTEIVTDWALRVIRTASTENSFWAAAENVQSDGFTVRWGPGAGFQKLELRVAELGSGSNLSPLYSADQIIIQNAGTTGFSVSGTLPSGAGILPGTDYVVWLMRENLVSGETVRSNTVLTVRTHEPSLAVTCLDDATGEPLPGVQVDLIPTQGGEGYSLATDDQGKILLDVPGGEYTISTDPQWYAGLERSVSVPDNPAESFPVVLRLSPAGKLTCRARTSDAPYSGYPVAGVHVEAVNLTWWQVYSGITDIYGSVQFGEVPVGLYDVTWMYPDYDGSVHRMENPVDVVQRTLKTPTCHHNPNGRVLSGNVCVEDAAGNIYPAAGTLVSIGGIQVAADEEGCFRLVRVSPGVHEVTASPTDPRFARASATVDLTTRPAVTMPTILFTLIPHHLNRRALRRISGRRIMRRRSLSACLLGIPLSRQNGRPVSE